MDSGIHIRKINATDNFALAKVIKDTMTEFGVNLPNTVFDDPTTDHLYELFQKRVLFTMLPRWMVNWLEEPVCFPQAAYPILPVS